MNNHQEETQILQGYTNKLDHITAPESLKARLLTLTETYSEDARATQELEEKLAADEIEFCAERCANDTSASVVTQTVLHAQTDTHTPASDDVCEQGNTKGNLKTTAQDAKKIIDATAYFLRRHARGAIATVAACLVLTVAVGSPYFMQDVMNRLNLDEMTSAMPSSSSTAASTAHYVLEGALESAPQLSKGEAAPGEFALEDAEFEGAMGVPQMQPDAPIVQEGTIDTAGTDAGMVEDTTANASGAGSQSDREETEQTTRKIIYTADVSLETKEFDATLAALDTAVKQVNGYLGESDQFKRTADRRFASFTYRIPAQSYNAFMTAVGDAGIVENKTETAQDVTSEYVDLSAHITTLTAQRDRLRTLQEQAEDLTDLIEIENALQDVQYELDSYQGQMRYLSAQIDYATVYISVDEVVEYTAPEETFLQKLAKSFTGGLQGFAQSVGNLVLWVISMVSWIAVIVVFVLVWRMRKKTKK